MINCFLVLFILVITKLFEEARIAAWQDRTYPRNKGRVLHAFVISQTRGLLMDTIITRERKMEGND